MTGKQLARIRMWAAELVLSRNNQSIENALEEATTIVNFVLGHEREVYHPNDRINFATRTWWDVHE